MNVQHSTVVTNTPKFGYLKFFEPGDGYIAMGEPPQNIEISSDTSSYGRYDVVYNEKVQDTVPADKFESILAKLDDSGKQDELLAENGQDLRNRLVGIVDELKGEWANSWTKAILRKAVQENENLHIVKGGNGTYLWLLS